MHKYFPPACLDSSLSLKKIKRRMRLARQVGGLHVQHNRSFVTEILETDRNNAIGSKSPFSFDVDATPRFDAKNKKLEHSTQ